MNSTDHADKIIPLIVCALKMASNQFIILKMSINALNQNYLQSI